MIVRSFLFCALAAAIVTPTLARAHSLEFGVLRIVEHRGGARLVLRAGAREGRPPALAVEVGGSCTLASRPSRHVESGLLVLDAELDCPRGLDGARVRVLGLADSEIDVAARIERVDAREENAWLDADQSDLYVAPAPSPMSVLARYLALGAEHIALGLDHLLFVLALLFIVFDARMRRERPFRLALATVTGFTLGHSVTLSLAASGVITLPSAPVEACIALSIVLLAAELLRASPSGLIVRWPWLIAAAFGLLHGLGFAGALVELGLPPSCNVAALVGFNLGVELGQVAFVAIVVLPLAWIARRPHAMNVQRAGAYAIGIVASVWLAARFDALFTGA